ncbi:MAG: insulinase family protein [Paludibacteraceae bacterium]|jgi:predicted Zn-dependent peptidase|nr:insulinase family protein [Paludibacteraceae bacterium]MCK9615983.1 insulinase family protein [Candidatus Omnitrophota bacterium]
MESGVFFEEETSGFGAIFAVFEAGGLFERKGLRGISHLAEHLKCKKEKDFMETINIYNIETNAFTDDDCVCFYCRSGDLEIAKFAKNYVLECLSYVPTEKEFEEEKSIILQEYDSYLNDYAIQMATSREIFRYDGPIGRREDIESITYKKFQKFYVEHFSKPVSVIFAGGKNIKKAYSSLCKTIETSVPCSKRKALEARFTNKTIVSEVKRQSDYQILISEIKRKDCGFSELSLKFFVNLLSDGFFSPLWENIREKKGLCYFIGYSVDSNKELFVYLHTETKHWEDFKETYFDILLRFEEFVTPKIYQDYLIKLTTKLRHNKMRSSSSEFIHRKYISNQSLMRSFDPKSNEYSYETMKKVSKYLLKKARFQEIVHHGKEITFSTN